MSAKLEQLLGYLDRKEVTEIMVGVGRPIALKMSGNYTPLTSLAVTQAQYDGLFGGTPLDALARGKGSEPIDCDIGRRRVHVEVVRRGEEMALRIQTAAAAGAAAPAKTQPLPTTTQPIEVIAKPAERTQPLEVNRADRSQPLEVNRADRSQPLAAHPADKRPRTPSTPMPVHPADMRPRTPSTPPPVQPREVRQRPATDMPSISIDIGPLDMPSEPAEPSAAPQPPTVPPVRFAAREKSDRIEVTPPTQPLPAVTPTQPLAPVAEPIEGGLLDERIDVSALAKYVRLARQHGASDLHLASGRPPMIRVMGELRKLDEEPDAMPADIVDRILLPLLGPQRRLQLMSAGYVDLAFEVQGGGRLRGNVSRQQTGLRAAFRLARVTPPTLDELNLPRDLAKVVAHHQGLVVIAGPNGQGKTTTLAALVDLVNSSKPYHIITIEDPVELEHPRKQAVISQREVGRHTKSFAAALKASLREDPDLIVIGELRDRETVEIALTAAETGHLVLATMSTPSAAKTIDRLIDMFPPEDQTQARASIAGALRAVVAQRLLPTAGGRGVVPAIELVTGVLPLAVLIRDDKLFQLPNLMQRGRAFGMIRFEDSLLDLLRGGKITEQTFHRHNPAAAAQSKATQAQQNQQVTQAMGRVGRREP